MRYLFVFLTLLFLAAPAAAQYDRDRIVLDRPDLGFQYERSRQPAPQYFAPERPVVYILVQQRAPEPRYESRYEQRNRVVIQERGVLPWRNRRLDVQLGGQTYAAPSGGCPTGNCGRR